MKVIKKRGEISRVVLTKEERENKKERDKLLKINPFSQSLKETFAGKDLQEKINHILDRALNSKMPLSAMIDNCRFATNFNETESLKAVVFINSKVERFAKQTRNIEKRFHDHCHVNTEEKVRAMKRNLNY